MEQKKLTLNDIKRVMGSFSSRTKTIQWHSASFDIKPMLTVDEYITTIRNIIGDCRSSDGENIALELVDFSIKANIIAAYAFVELPKEANSLFDIVYRSDLYEYICKVANSKQIDAIKEAVWTIIRFM